MSRALRALAFVATLTAVLTPAAFAGGVQATVEGPSKDGTYLVRTYHCHRAATMPVSAYAEGVVNGTRRTLALALQSTREEGVFTFERAWPKDGRWLVRLDMGGNLSLVAAVARDGRVNESQ